MNCYRNQQKGGLKPAHETHERRAAYHQHSEVLHCTSPFDSIPSTLTTSYLHAGKLEDVIPDVDLLSSGTACIFGH